MAIGAFYFFLALFIPGLTRRFPAIFSRSIQLSVILFGFSCLLMSWHQNVFDFYFSASYLLRLTGFLLLLSGVFIYLMPGIKKNRKFSYRFKAEVKKRILAEQDLVRQQNLLGLIEEMAKLGSWELNLETKEVFWSDEMYSILGKDKSTYTPSFQSWEDTIVPSDVENVRLVMGNAILNNLPYSIDFQIRRPDGVIRHLRGQGYFSSTYNKSINTLLDITELRETNYKLLQSESLLREAEALAHNGSWEWSQEKNAFYWSDELYRIHGLEPESAEVDLRFYLGLIHPDDVQHFVTVLADTQTTLSPFSINYRIVKADGEVRYLSLNGKFKTDFSGNVNKVLGNTQDVTELKMTSMKLERSESIYRTIARNVPDSAVFLFDEKLKLLLTQGPALYTIDPEGCINDFQSFHSGIFETDFLQCSKYVEEALLGKESRLEHRIQQKIFKITYTPVHVAGGEILGVMVVMHDITDLKKAQVSLEAKVTELNRSNKDLEQFAYTASHDLQEPLRKIRAFGERIKLKYSNLLPAEGLDYINRMSSASERMQLLIDDLLTFSKISRPGEELQPLNLEEIINQVVQDLEYSIEKKGAVIHIDVKHNLKVIPLQLRQLFQNLFSNSLKFAKEEVPLCLEVTSVTIRGQEHRDLLDEKEYCMIEVCDNGIGFDKQFERKIFTLFYRLHSRTEYEGTGIGLAICKKIVENHNGIIEAEGEESKGATFRIFIPID